MQSQFGAALKTEDEQLKRKQMDTKSFLKQ